MNMRHVNHFNNSTLIENVCQRYHRIHLEDFVSQLDSRSYKKDYWTLKITKKVLLRHTSQIQRSTISIHTRNRQQIAYINIMMKVTCQQSPKQGRRGFCRGWQPAADGLQRGVQHHLCSRLCQGLVTLLPWAEQDCFGPMTLAQITALLTLLGPIAWSLQSIQKFSQYHTIVIPEFEYLNYSLYFQFLLDKNTGYY
jgi:hypothetical protein